MSKKENPTPMEEQETPVAGETAEVEETPAEENAPETFTLTREQMEKMEGLAGQLAALNDQHLRLAAETGLQPGASLRADNARLASVTLARRIDRDHAVRLVA